MSSSIRLDKANQDKLNYRAVQVLKASVSQHRYGLEDSTCMPLHHHAFQKMAHACLARVFVLLFDAFRR